MDMQMQILILYKNTKDYLKPRLNINAFLQVMLIVVSEKKQCICELMEL